MSTSEATSAQPQVPSSPNSSNSQTSSPTNSISLIRLDELSSFGATKQNRLPALIKLNPLADSQQVASNSMPDFSATQVEKMVVTASHQQAESLPANLLAANKENAKQTKSLTESASNQVQHESVDDFQVVNMEEGEQAQLMGPSLPAQTKEASEKTVAFSATSLLQNLDAKSLSAQLQSTNLTGQYTSHLGDSLIEMIINLRNENQNLIRALETNNEYVKERLSEFKRVQEEAKKREAQYAMEKAEFEHQARKLRRQNEVLSGRMKSLEAKLKAMNVEVSESLDLAHSSQASSVRGAEMYPQLSDMQDESFGNSALNNERDALATTIQMDATSGELYNTGDQPSTQMDTSNQNQPTTSSDQATRVGAMSKEELSKHFDANKAEFYALDDPMKQCDRLEQQLNDIGKRDYEICLLQQQLNIYRQDFRLERMAKLEAKIQIEKLKNDIDRLCLERVQQRHQDEQTVHFGPTTTIPATNEQGLIGKLGHHLSKKAARSAIKAAKYAAKQAHLEEKAANAMARAAAAKAAASSHFTVPKPTDTADQQQQQQQSDGTQVDPSSYGHHHRHQRHHRGHHRSSSSSGGRPAGIRSEVMNDLLSTANKAMLTGYKMVSTHVNLGLDKLSQYEQQQASQLDPANRPPIQQAQQQATKQHTGPSAPPMDPPSMD